MAISTDALNATFADHKGPLVFTFVRRNILLDTLLKTQRVVQEGGTYFERNFTGGAPAYGVGLFDGTEPLDGTIRRQIKKIQVAPHRIAAAINIPKKELDINSGDAAVIRLIEEYPQAVIEAAYVDLNAFMLTGVSAGLLFQTSELAGFITLNGAFSSGVGTGVTNGLLDFALPASQSDVVEGVTKDASYGWVNQYADATSYSTNGMITARKLYRQCAHYNTSSRKGPSLGLFDPDSFSNIENDLLSYVRIERVEDKRENSDTTVLSFMGAQIYDELAMDRALSLLSGTPAADGFGYFLSPSDFEFILSTPPDVSDFEERHGGLDVVTAIFAMQGNLICKNLRTQGAITGLAV